MEDGSPIGLISAPLCKIKPHGHIIKIAPFRLLTQSPKQNGHPSGVTVCFLWTIQDCNSLRAALRAVARCISSALPKTPRYSCVFGAPLIEPKLTTKHPLPKRRATQQGGSSFWWTIQDSNSEVNLLIRVKVSCFVPICTFQRTFKYHLIPAFTCMYRSLKAKNK